MRPAITCGIGCAATVTPATRSRAAPPNPDAAGHRRCCPPAHPPRSLTEDWSRTATAGIGPPHVRGAAGVSRSGSAGVAFRRPRAGGWATPTGQGAWCSRAWLTEPSMIASTPPWPRRSHHEHLGPKCGRQKRGARRATGGLPLDGHLGMFLLGAADLPLDSLVDPAGVHRRPPALDQLAQQRRAAGRRPGLAPGPDHGDAPATASARRVVVGCHIGPGAERSGDGHRRADPWLGISKIEWFTSVARQAAETRSAALPGSPPVRGGCLFLIAVRR